MAFAACQDQRSVTEMLQRSLGRGRLAHAYLFTGDRPDTLEAVARTLAKALHCSRPVRAAADGPAIDCCDRCSSCLRVEQDNHPDVLWVRPESKRREVRIHQVRQLMHRMAHKPSEGRWKVAVLVGADRMNDRAANALLKTLEEPPGDSVLVLLATEPERLLETVLSRCLRLRFEGGRVQDTMSDAALEWLREFAGLLHAGKPTVLGRYRLLGRLLSRLADLKTAIDTELTERSPLEAHQDADRDLLEKWEAELAAAVESEYRRQRTALLAGLEWLLRDIWLKTLHAGDELLALPVLQEATTAVAARLDTTEALENLRNLSRLGRLLETNAQEALVLEVGLLKLRL